MCYIKKQKLSEYKNCVQWIKDHVAPDDIYDLAHQGIMAAECLIDVLKKTCDENNIDFNEIIESNGEAKHWFNNVMGIETLKNNNFKGFLCLDVEAI